MKKYLLILLVVCLMLTAVSMPASALTFDSPPTGDFAAPTSDGTIYEWSDPNVDRSKNNALIPPGFGTPTSYLPNSGVGKIGQTKNMYTTLLMDILLLGMKKYGTLVREKGHVNLVTLILNHSLKIIGFMFVHMAIN